MSNYVFELSDVSIANGSNTLQINNSDSVFGVIPGSELFIGGYVPVTVLSSDNTNKTVTLSLNWPYTDHNNVIAKIIPVTVGSSVLSALTSMNTALAGALDSIENAVNNRSSFEAEADKLALRNELGRLRAVAGTAAQDVVNVYQLNGVKTTADNAIQISDAVADEVDAIVASINALTADPLNAVTSIFIPPNAMTPVLGSPVLSVASSRMAAWLLSKEVAAVSFLFRAPSHWSSVDVTFLIANTAANAGDVSLSAEVHNWSAGESINQTPTGTGVIHSVASQLWVSETPTTSLPITLDPAKYSTIRIARYGESENDTLSNAIALLGVILEVHT